MQPLVRGESKKFLSRVGGFGLNLSHTLHGPGVVQVLERWQIVANHLLGHANDTLPSASVLGSRGRVPDGDGAGQDGLSDGV